jgi:hypothetical protein
MRDERFLSIVGGLVIEDGGSPGRANVLLARMQRLAGSNPKPDDASV